MKIGKRNLRQLLRALMEKQHYIALVNSVIVYPYFFDSFVRYFFGKGSYAAKIKVRTPLGIIEPKIFSYYDMLTINEIFCRMDYKADKKLKVVMDVGSNIGISALYFLTRNDYVKCYLFEPVPENADRLKENLKQFNGRYKLEQVAISDIDGYKRFGIDPYGRCGGLLREAENYINVRCIDINHAIKTILEKEPYIDILKIDTEGNEFDILKSISKEYLSRIKTIYIEIDHTINLDNNFKFFPEHYHQSRYGNTIKLKLKTI